MGLQNSLKEYVNLNIYLNIDVDFSFERVLCYTWQLKVFRILDSQILFEIEILFG
jgi:hypothetical protein